MEDAPAPVSRISSSLARSLLRAGIPGIAVLAIVLSCAEAVAAPKLNPFRGVRKLSQAEAAPPAAPAQPAPEAQGPRAGDVCRADDQCPGGTICERNVCTPVEPPIHALLFRKEGGATAFIPFYFHRRGNPGYRVIAPFYWHFWSPEGKTNIVAPFYWRFQDYLARRVVTVIPPYSHTIQPDAESWAIWPIFYRSTKFGWAAPLLLSFKIQNPDEQRSMGLYALLYFWKRNREANTAFDLFFPFVVSNRSTDHNFTWFLPLNFYWRNGAGDKAHSNLLLLPLLYRNKNPEGATTISLLGYGHSRGRNSNGSIAWLYWYGRRADGGGYDLLLPLFYNSRRPTGSTLGSPLGYYSRDGENKRGAVAWLYWFGRQRVEGDQRKSYDILFPFVWSFRSPQSSTTVLPPLFLHMRRPTYTFTTLFPLYWASRDPQKGLRLEGVLPAVFLPHRRGGADLHLGDTAGRLPAGQRAQHPHAPVAAAVFPPARSPARDRLRAAGVPAPPQPAGRHRHHAAAELLPAQRSPGVDHHLLPDLLAFPGRRHRRHRPHAAPVLLPAQRARRKR